MFSHIRGILFKNLKKYVACHERGYIRSALVSQQQQQQQTEANRRVKLQVEKCMH